MNQKSRGGLVRIFLGAAAFLAALAAFAVTAFDPASHLPGPRAPSASVSSAAGPGLPGTSAARRGVRGSDPAFAPAVQGDRIKRPPPAGAAEKARGEPSELLIFLHPGTDPAAYARDHGLVHTHTLRSDPDAHVFSAPDGATAKAAHDRSKADARARKVFFNERTQRIHCAWTPDDPYYNNDNNPAGFPGQWHLGNGASTTHANLVPAWNRDITGTGVLFAIVDDCLQINHPDLQPNYVAADSWDFGQNDGDPSPVHNGGSTEDRHGTSVAGVAAARGGNGIGVTGAAPLAGLAGLRVDFPTQTSQMFVDATLYHSSGGNTNIKVKNHSYGYSTPFVDTQAERDAVATSAAAGTIHCFAAGNERGNAGQDSNKEDVQSSPDVIAVAAIGSDGKFSYYSSFGANVFVTAPSSGAAGLFGITTTDRTAGNGYNRTTTGSDGDAFPDRDYTSTFGGTSSATPLVAGVITLAKQVQPNLNVRFAKHLLVRASRLVDSTDSTVEGGGDGSTPGSAWKTNAAGRKFNENYGFGMIDADALTQEAVLWSGVTALQTESTGTVTVTAGSIPDNTPSGVNRTFALASTTPLEEMLVTLDVTHTYRGDLEAYLTSPSGTMSRLAIVSGGDNGVNLSWTFVSNAFWGENPAGTWTLNVRDVAAVDVGTWNTFAVTARVGQLVASSSAPVVSSIQRAGASPTSASSVDFTVTFTKNVTGVDATDFALTTTGSVSGASIAGVSGSGSIYTVTVNTGSGDGTIRLDLIDNDSIVDGSGNKLGGTGAGNGNFTAGQVYTIDKTAPSLVHVTSTTANGSYGLGASINVTVDFTEAVTLAGGNLLVTLSTGDVVSIGPFGPSTTAGGTYVVGAGDNSPDLDSASPLTLSGGATLRDAAGNACALGIPGGQNLAALKALVVDTTAPQVVRIRSTSANQTYGAGAAINVTVDFSEAVTLTGGNLLVTLSTGAVVTIGPFPSSTSASGTYTVAAGQNSPDLNAQSPLTLSAGTLRDAAGNNCVLTIPAGQDLADLQDIVVDTAGPAVTINQAVGQADPTNAGPIRFTVVFSEPVTGFDSPSDVSFAGSTAGGPLAASITPVSPTTYTVSVTGMTSGGTVVASIPAGKAADLIGNPNVASSSTDNVVTFDNLAPTVTINQAGGQADPAGTSPISFTVVFSKPVFGFATGDVTLGGTAGATTAIITGSGTTYTVAVSGMTSDGTVIATVGAGVATDLAGNGNAASTSTDNIVIFDQTPPSVTINQAVSQSDPTSSGPIRFSVVFSESVTGFNTTHIVLTPGPGLGGVLVPSVSGSGALYVVSVTGMTGAGTLTATISAGAASDAAGHPSLASTSTDNVVTFDASVPTVTINQAGGQADPTNAGPITFTVVFSQSVFGFGAAGVSLAGSTAPGATVSSVSGSGTTWTVTVSGMTSSGTVVAAVLAGAAQNGVGTGNAASTSADNVVTYDVTRPTVTINQAAGQADPTNLSPLLYTVVFSESVTGFGPGGVVLGGTAGATGKAVSGSGTTWTVTVSGMTGSGTVTATVAANAATDAAGNLSFASTSTDNTVIYDVTPPTVTINQAAGQADPSNGSPILFTAVFTKTVTGFTGSGVVLGGTAGATTAVVSGSGTTYTVSVSGMTGDGTVIASVSAGAAVDAAGNPSAASTSTDNVVTRDATRPGVTINQAAGQADPTNGASIDFTVVFSKSITGFGPGGVVLGGTAGATGKSVSGSGTTWTLTVSGMTGPGTVTAAVAANAATDAAGNLSLASTSTDNTVTWDNSPLTVTINQAGGQADPTNSPSILFTAIFNKPVANFTTGDVTLGGTAGATTAIVTGGGTTYTVTVSGMSADGTVIASIAAGVASDAAGNANSASTSGDNTVTYDGTAPTVTINQAAAQADPAKSSPIAFTAVFSKPVSGFTASDVVVGGTAGGTATVTGGPSTFTVNVSGMSGDGKVVVTIPAGAATDAAGNPNEASTSTDNSVTYDTTPPTVTDVSSPTPNGFYSTGASIVVTVTFSEPVIVTGVPRLTLETGAIDAVVAYSGGTGTSTLSFAYTVAAGHVSADLNYVSTSALALNGGTIRDPAGNDAVLTLPGLAGPGSLASNKNLVVDTTPPVAGTVKDGWTGPDVDVQLSVTTISANWSGFSDPESGIGGYEWAIGTTPGGQQVRAFSSVGLQTSASTSAVDVILALATGTPYHVTVRATNGAGLTTTATSDGVTVTGTDLSGPAAPPAFLATPSDQAVLLEWLPSPSGDVASYRLWWKPAASPWTAATRVDALPGPTATVSALTNGSPYDFMIKAVDTSGNESPGVFASATPVASITIGGTGNYGTIQAAIGAAQPGDTVNVGPGTYNETLILAPGVSVCGSSANHTIIVGTPGTAVITVQGTYLTDPTSTVCDLAITGGTIGVSGGTADVLLDHLIIHHGTSHGAASGAGGRLRAVNCTVISNGGDGINSLGTTAVRNCIVGKNGGTGLNVPGGSPVTYNDVYSNPTANYPAGVGGIGNLTSAAAFVDETAFNYIENPSSPSVDAGDPADPFSQELSPNGSRINQGAFGNTPWAASLAAATPAGVGGGGGGGHKKKCGATGLEILLLLGALAAVRRRRS